jgi:hypothetical protein
VPSRVFIHRRTRTPRRQWLESHGVPISQEFVDFAETIGLLISACENESDYVAWLRYTENSIVTCDSDSPKAFKVYRHDHVSPFVPVR